jgi:hypothetical protein
MIEIDERLPWMMAVPSVPHPTTVIVTGDSDDHCHTEFASWQRSQIRILGSQSGKVPITDAVGMSLGFTEWKSNISKYICFEATKTR